MRAVVVMAIPLLALTLTACIAVPGSASAGPSASIPITDLSSTQPSTPPPSTPPPATPEATAPEPTAPPATEAPPTQPSSTVAAAAGGSPAADCRDGWSSPVAGTELHQHALALLSAQMGVGDAWSVEKMRYFTGPEVPFSEPAYEPVERWYVKAALIDDPSFRARWILERRTDLIQGISAVAPYESEGFLSPDWTAFVGEGEPVSYLGLPGQWSGIAYDFVTGEGDSGNPGLPNEVLGCVSGT